MHFELVHVEAFGGLFDQDLPLAPGMTVVCGPNEAGKSTWHTAMYAAVCGMRRGKGQPRKADRAFESRNRPWDRPSEWAVRTVLELDNGRRLEIRQDLAFGLGNFVHDLSMGGRDATSEVLHDGMPDGAKWLGLDRDSFSVVACIRQAEILRVLESAGQLQKCLQQAAASTRGDSTAALALERIKAYRTDHVGLDRSNSTKPLRQSIDKLSAAERRLARAQETHETFIVTLKRAQSSREIAQDARLHQVTVEAAQALNQADDLTSRVARAADLAARFPERPQTITEDDDLATLVAGALSAYRQRPDAPNPPTHCSVDIKLELDAIPEMPEGDLEAPPGVASAHTASADARRRLELHEETPPSEAVLPDARGLTADELRHLADTVAENEAAPDSLPPPDFLPHASPESAPLRSRRGHMLVGIGGALAILGAVVAVAVGVVAGLVTLAVGVVVALAGLTHLVLRQAQPALDEGQIRAAAARRVEEDLTRQREDALHELGEHGLPEGPDALRALADQLTTATHDQRASAQWHERDTELREALETADGNFRRELVATTSTRLALLTTRGPVTCGVARSETFSPHTRPDARASKPNLRPHKARKPRSNTAAASKGRRRSRTRCGYPMRHGRSWQS